MPRHPTYVINLLKRNHIERDDLENVLDRFAKENEVGIAEIQDINTCGIVCLLQNREDPIMLLWVQLREWLGHFPEGTAETFLEAPQRSLH